ncbi:Retrovirus-related Pol polyprotein [Operophtera brumata]|uniref:Retrovirus-related Pol polyprotein n=1 Tax=Operophtera brumata TaxID=104452 RepID=A0A0L7LF23_OPEBR|nr:Retrovirus-related Pol polyprotein [Operophtera brumata]
MDIPLLPTFSSTNWHTFYLYDVDARYDGLIGNDLLEQLGAVIDLKEQLLKTDTTCIPIINNNLNYHSGEAILDFYEFRSGLQMPSAIVNCINGYASTVIQNTLEQPQRLTIKRPFTVQKPQMQISDVSMRTAPPRPQVTQQGFKLNELTMNEYEYGPYYDDSYYYDENSYYDENGVNYYSEENYTDCTDTQPDVTEQTDVPKAVDFQENASKDKRS